MAAEPGEEAPIFRKRVNVLNVGDFQVYVMMLLTELGVGDEVLLNVGLVDEDFLLAGGRREEEDDVGAVAAALSRYPMLAYLSYLVFDGGSL